MGITYQHNIVQLLKASRTLNFIKRTLYRCSKEVKETAYLTLVRPFLEYASSVCNWDPYQLYLISNIEKIYKEELPDGHFPTIDIAV